MCGVAGRCAAAGVRVRVDGAVHVLAARDLTINGYQNLRDKDVSKNSGTPKSSILIGLSLINHPFWATPIFGNTQINLRKDLPKVEGFFQMLGKKSFQSDQISLFFFCLLIPLGHKMESICTSLRRSFSQKTLKPWVIQQTFVVFR